MRVRDRQNLRREYLRKKAATVSKRLIGILLFVCIVVFILFAPFEIPVLIFIGSLFACPLIHAFVKKAGQEEAALIYIPPVSANSLPAEEVLVRASHEPAHEQDTMLLRAAAVSADTPAEELLRASIGERQQIGNRTQ